MEDIKKQNLIRKAIIDCDNMIIHYYKEQLIKTYGRLLNATTKKDREEEHKRIEQDLKLMQKYVDIKNILEWCLNPTDNFPYR